MKRLLCLLALGVFLLSKPATVWALFDTPRYDGPALLLSPQPQVLQIAQAASAETSMAQFKTEEEPAVAILPDKIFETKFTTIYYKDEKDLDDFIWRLGGERLEYNTDPQLASHRVDQLLNRVQMILDMWPENLAVAIHLHRGPLQTNKVAYYDYDTQSIHISVDYTSDGVLAHELAHACIDQYFTVPPPSKMQEILAQYVDKNLWSDYY